jgi:2-hydroxy-4-carboxymuconate semialdehyde hemiacetal dehydrogenase
MTPVGHPASRVAIVGPGAMADVHAEALVTAGCSIATVVGPHAGDLRDFADRHDVPSSTTSLDEALTSEALDAVVVCSPSHVHAEQAIRSLAAGKHVLCEIPAGLSLAEAQAVAAAAMRFGRNVMVGHTMRYWAPVVELRRLVEDSGFRPTHVIARMAMLRQTNVGWTGRQRDWVDNVLWHHGAHVVDTVLWLLNEPVVTVQASRGADWDGSGTHMDVGIGLATASGSLASIALSYHARVERNDYLVIGVDETYEIREGRLFSSAGTVVDRGPVADVQSAAVRAQDARFAACVRGEASGYPSVEDVLPAMRVLEDAQVSGRQWQVRTDTSGITLEERTPES